LKTSLIQLVKLKQALVLVLLTIQTTTGTLLFHSFLLMALMLETELVLNKVMML